MKARFPVQLKFIVNLPYAKHGVCWTRWKSPRKTSSGPHLSGVSSFAKDKFSYPKLSLPEGENVSYLRCLSKVISVSGGQSGMRGFETYHDNIVRYPRHRTQSSWTWQCLHNETPHFLWRRNHVWEAEVSHVSKWKESSVLDQLPSQGLTTWKWLRIGARKGQWHMMQQWEPNRSPHSQLFES